MPKVAAPTMYIGWQLNWPLHGNSLTKIWRSSLNELTPLGKYGSKIWGRTSRSWQLIRSTQYSVLRINRNMVCPVWRLLGLGLNLWEIMFQGCEPGTTHIGKEHSIIPVGSKFNVFLIKVTNDMSLAPRGQKSAKAQREKSIQWKKST